MRVCLISSMRDAGPYLPHWRRMVEQWTVQPTRIVVAENDSTDDTVAQLEAWPAVTRESFTTGEAKLPREASARRSEYLARCYTRAIDRAMTFDDWDIALVMSAQKFVGPPVLHWLCEDAARCDVVAPFVLHPASGGFYDTWCFQHLAADGTDGAMFTAEDYRLPPALYEVASVGGVYLVQRAVFAAGCRPGGTNGCGCDSVPLCQQARAQGFHVWADGRLQAIACWEPAELEQYVAACDPMQASGVAA